MSYHLVFDTKGWTTFQSRHLCDER